MATVNTNLTFSAEQQSLWMPGRAVDLTIDSGDTMIWDPAPITKDFGASALGFSFNAQFYMDVRFGLLAYASLGTGGHFDADYNIALTIELPAAVKANNAMVFDYTKFEVTSSSITTAGFGTPESSSAGKIGAGLDLIIELEAGFRNLTFGHWFGEEGPFSFLLFPTIKEQIPLLEVDLLSPEFELELTDGVTLTARLPTGASIGESTSSAGGGVVSGEGASETQFLSLDADLDALLVRLLDKIPAPPVQAVAKFLGDFVFAEHTFDIGKKLGLGEGKAAFNVTLLDITANAGLMVTEEVSLDINQTGTEIPNVLITLVSDNGTADNTDDDITTTGRLGQILSLLSPDATGTGTAVVTATYEIDKATFFHGVGVGINASITIDALSGYLTGAWVPEALAFGFGPLFSTTIPDGGLQINLGNLYEDTFEIDGSVFGTQTESYNVFYVAEELVPTNWDPNLPNAEETIYAYFRAAHEQLAAIQSQYSNLGFEVRPSSGTPASSYNYTTLADKVMFIWTGLFTQTVTLNTSNGSVSTIDLASTLGSAEWLKVKHQSETFFMDASTPNYFIAESLYSISANPLGTLRYVLDDGNGATVDKSLISNGSVNVRGTQLSDAIMLYRDDTSFIDGGNSFDGLNADLFIGNFAAYYGDVAIRWDLLQSVTEERDSDPLTLGGIRLFEDDATITDLTVRNIERVALLTGGGDDYLSGWTFRDLFITGNGNDVVIMPADIAGDFSVLEGGDDAYIGGFAPISAGVGSVNDIIYGGSGIDNAFITPGERGLRYDVIAYNFSLAQPSLRFGATNGIGADAGWLDIETFYGSLLINAYSIFAADPGSVIVPVSAAGPQYQVLLRDGTSLNAMQFKQDFEFISIIDGGAGNDLAIYMGGTRYQGGAGTDTFAASFALFDDNFGTRGGINLVVGRAGIDGFYGETIIDGFERILVEGTTADDVLRGGAFADYLRGEAGNDVLSGGDDAVADTIIGDDGNDTIFWANGGADSIRGGSGTDRLEVSANGAEDHGLYYRFVNLLTGQLVEGSYIYYWAYDPAALLLDAVEFATSPGVNDSIDLSFSGLDFAITQQIETMNIQGSALQDDLLIYMGGSRYVGGETANDQDVFVADLTGINSAMNFTITDDEAPDGSDGYLLGNFIYLQGIDRGVIHTGGGDDRMLGGRLDDHFETNAGNDTLYGAGGNNELFGGAGNDLFMWAAEGNDTMSGGTFRNFQGRDVLVQAGGNEDSSLRMFNAAGVELTAFGAITAASSHADLKSAIENALFASRFIYDSGTYTVDYSNMSKVEFAGTDANDEIVLFQYGTSYLGGESAGDADLFAGDFRFDVNPSVSFGDMTFDALSSDVYDAGDGIRIGGFERFHLQLGLGNHLVVGGDLGDAVYGNGGYITFLSGAGDDIFEAGVAGSLFEHTGGNDTITSSAGIDVLTFSATGAVEVTQLDAFGNPIGPILSRVAGLQNISVFQDALNADVRQTVITHGTNSITFDAFEEVFATGSTESDVLIGGFGQNYLAGGDGDDVMVARGNGTVMIGGNGADTYVFDILFESAVILDETSDGSFTDTILMFTGAAYADLSFANDGLDLLITTVPAGFAPSTVRIVDYFATGPNGYDFAMMTTDGFFTIDLSFLGAYTGLAVPASGIVIGTIADEDFGAGNHIGREVHMGGGNDFALAGSGEDLFFGGNGQDGVSYRDATGGVRVDLRLQVGTGNFAEGDLYSSIEHAAGSLFDDAMVGSNFANTLVSDDGDDSLYGNDGDDGLYGGAGADYVEGGNNDDVIQGDEGNDTLSGDHGSDVIFGGDGADSIEGGDDADVIETGTGNDTARGGAGDDILIYTGDGLDEFDGGAGADWINFENHGVGVRVNLLTGAQVESSDDMGNPILIATLAEIENIRGTIETDELIGDNQDNVIDGVLGSDYMVGHAGDDTFIGGGGNAAVDYSQETGGQGVNLVFQASTPGLSAHIAGTDSHGDDDLLFNINDIGGTNFADTIQGNDNDNTIVGFDGDDFLNGLSGNDQVSGEGGNDNLRGSFGSDTLIGGSGTNVMLGEDGDDQTVSLQDATFDTHFGGNGFDVASYAFFDEGVQVINGTEVWKNGVQIGLLDSIEHFVGGSGNDVVQLGAYPDPYTPTGYLEVYSYTGGYDEVHGRALFTGGSTLSYALFDAAVEVRLVTGITRTTDSETVGQGTYRSITEFTDIRTVIGSDYNDALDGADMVPSGSTPNFSNLYGGAGNDSLRGLGGVTQLYGGDGDDYLEAFIPIVEPSEGPPNYGYLLEGGAGFDFVKFTGRTGWDISLAAQYSTLEIYGIEGVIGSSGNDRLEGDAGANTFRGEGGDDIFEGRVGNDVMIYTSGLDLFRGGIGIDTFDLSEYGQAVRVNLGLAAGTVQTNDTASAASGVFRDLANAPDLDVESAIGTDFNDRLVGNDGINLLNGGLGNDTLLGQGGNDLLVYSGGLDRWDGGDGSDTGNFSTFGFAIDVNLARSGVTVLHRGGTNVNSGTAVDMAILSTVENVMGTVHDDLILGNNFANLLWGNGGADRLSGQGGDDSVYGGDASDQIFGGTGNDSIIGGLTGADVGDNIDGGDGNDTVFGEGGNDTILGQDGNDSLKGGDGNDTVNGGDGNNVLYGDRGSDLVVAGVGNDAMSGGEGDDTLLGGAGLDSLDGGTGDDQLSGGTNVDVLIGGDGNDTLIGGASADVMNGGDGFDTVSFADLIAAVRVELGEGNMVAVALNGAAGDVITNAEGLIGTTRNDTLVGNSVANRLVGGLGNDTLLGLDGNDMLDGGDRDDRLEGGNGRDLMMGGTGLDRMFGQSGDDLMYGGDGNDTLLGDENQDEIYGGVGADVVDGGTGDDQLFGDGNADTVRGGEGIDAMYGGDSDDVLIGGTSGDALYGGNGNDTANYATAATGVTADLALASLNTGDAAGDIFDSIENLVGSNLADRLSGNSQSNRIFGGGGNDTILGQGGNDTLDGGEHNDDIYGGVGTDSILGGNGQDRLYGGNTSDNMSGDAGNDLVLGDAGNDTVAGGSGNDTIEGGNGLDRIHAGSGTDSIYGGADADVFVFLAANELGNAAAMDSIFDFVSGVDKLDLSAIQLGLSFIGGVNFTGTAGEMRYTITSGIGQLSVDLNGDSLSDGSILFRNGVALLAGDFIL